jgi:hypothetical protein
MHIVIPSRKTLPLQEYETKIVIPIYTQQDATLHSLFYLETALHISDGTSTHHQKRKQLYLQHLVFVTPLLLPAAIAVDTVVCVPDDG